MKSLLFNVITAGYLIILIGLSGCSSSNGQSSVMQSIGSAYESAKNYTSRAIPDGYSDAASQEPELVWDQWIRKGAPAVYMQPQSAPVTMPTALFFPFMSKIDVPEGKHISRELSRMVWQNWISHEVFPVIEFADYATYYTPERAIMLARQRGASLAIGGYITRYLAGGTVADTHIALQLEIYDASNGQLIWSMAHTGLMQYQFTKDYILFTARTRLPTDPTWAIMQCLSADLAKPVKKWLEPLKLQLQQAAEAGTDKAF